ncbi:MAG TPA: mandelate racemase/muconate lactonizing enzyme family protein [Isosphaeraceae bacterium]
MRIADLDALVLGPPGRRLTIVRLATDAGRVGLGAARLAEPIAPVLAYLGEKGPRLLVGADPFEPGKLAPALRGGTPARAGGVGAAAAALIEVACWDLIGQALGVPVYRLLGGAVRDRIPACASGWWPQERSPEALAAAAQRVATAGYRALTLEPFGAGDAEPSRAELHGALDRGVAVRAAVGPDVEIVVALGGRFTPAAAVRVARVLERIEPGWLQEPIPPGDPGALRDVARRIRCPVSAGAGLPDRGAFRELLQRRACDLIGPDLTRVGGLGEARTLAALAEVFSLQVALRGAAGPVVTAANLHLAATLPNLRAVEHVIPDIPVASSPGPEVDPTRDVISGGPVVVAGAFPLPEGPGLGVSLNEEALRAAGPQVRHVPLGTAY